MDDRSHRNYREQPLSRKHSERCFMDCNDYQRHYTKDIATLGRECKEWAEGETNEAVEAFIAEVCNPWDAVVFTYGSVKRGVKSGWAYTIRVSGGAVDEGSGVVEITTSNILMEANAIT